MRAIRVCLALLLLSAMALGQATLRGVTTDPSGSRVPGAIVALTGPKGESKSTKSGDDGAYVVSGLELGQWTVQATAPGLAMPRGATIVLHAGSQVLNLQLELTEHTEQVAVQDAPGATVSVEAANNASALVLRGHDLEALSDDPTDLGTDLQALAGPSAGPNGSQVYIDGFSGGEIPSKASIREVRINQNPFSPEYEQIGLGRIEILTRPGSDRLHGMGFFNLGTDVWNSRNPYAAQKAPFLLREFGGNIGGPLSRRASFFLDVRRDATDNGSIINAVTLDPAFEITPFTAVYDVPQRAIRVSPRIDYQLDTNNTLTVRYAFSHMDVPGAGIGGFNLTSRGYDALTTSHTLQIAETAVLGGNIVNEVRFQYFRSVFDQNAIGAGPAILVAGSFNGGAATVGRSSDRQNDYELQDYISQVRGPHTLRYGARLRWQQDDNISPQNFNGTFSFNGGPGLNSIEQYRQALLFGARPSQFSIAAGLPGISLGQFDAGLFLGDDWRVRPNLTVSLGARYEGQTNIADWLDLAPRAGIAWAPRPGRQGQAAKTVVRAGFGIFYQRFALANTLIARRFNGITQRQYVVTNPDFFPNPPSVDALASSKSPQIIEEVSSSLRAPYIFQTAVALERQLPANTSIAVTYANSHGLHMLRSRDINAPIPDSGAYPFDTPNPLFLMESAGLYNQNQLIANVNTRVNPKVSLFGSYTLNHALSNTDGVNTFPANQYDLSGEYGPAATDVRHRMTTGGSVDFPWNLRVSPLVILQSGPPFDITSGQDSYGTTLFNARPAMATDVNKPGVIATPYGLLDPNPAPGERILPRNYGRGPGLIMVNLRLSKTIVFGEPKGPHPYNLIISMAVRNIINHNNPGAIIGNITSPLFGQANLPAGANDLGGGGFSEAANNRRLELQIRFTF
ncbi:MAG TPA: carboxypeptidase regulatory-like domain-containing protein [Bryobacteraceae bacterium]|nr:carboxypeptidase regulatory-like domain-containing protein [Bryobacteraceae bacterium]